ncbi:putative O-glycosylation ligase, exosortase A system-associated [Sphingosinicella humi]|uniref:Putative O-glycosylation ligase, exosortase A system-associated n=1 Tax=Allosphingosinicella humi TaxID=2068657 RepID=A0A2U2J1G0_9SPHN|nr:putative O-glycosylation ligase, exosortase A system-associated [Sphingosinicella humi]PWG02177.1 putative O-glycosylation ligase, exosortase A system-associated [Sphingosinicella humi]
MRDLALIGFLTALLGLGLKRPFLFVLAYAYVDIVSPQRLSYYLLNSIPVSMIVAGLAFAGWLIADDKRHLKVTGRQWLMLVLLAYAGWTTLRADLYVEALSKWDWVWKAMAWAIFLPLTLRTRLRIEAYLLFMILSAAAIVIVGGIKTLLSGGGYGVLHLMVDNNSGLYEGSTIATVAIAIIPVILWLARFGTVYARDWRVRLFASALILACLLIPVGTEARTGLVCAGALAIFLLREAKNRIAYMAMIALAVVVAVPFLPQSFTGRMSTIQTYEADASASTRLAVWAWTWDYAKENPLGGGFEAYRQNSLRVKMVSSENVGVVELVDRSVVEDQGRAYHSSYFEMLGEQGFPGLILFLLIHGIGLIRMEVLRRRHRGAEGDQAWISPLATALQNGHLVYLVGSLFIGIAWQPFIYMLIAVQIGFDTYVSRRANEGTRRPWRKAPLAASPAV